MTITLDTELSHVSQDALHVRVKMDFGNNEHIRAFPNNISGWEGSDYDTTRVAESLGADVMLMRSYGTIGKSQQFSLWNGILFGAYYQHIIQIINVI